MVLTLLAFTLGIGAMAVLFGYIPPVPASWLGAILAFGLSSLVLGRRFLLSLAGSALAPLAFLSVGNASLLLGMLAVLVLLSILPEKTFDRFRRLPLEPQTRALPFLIAQHDAHRSFPPFLSSA